MDDLQRLLIERACERLVNVYANRIDAYDHDGFMQLWSDAPVWNVLGTEWRGLDGIRAGLEMRDQTMICRHLVTNIVIEAIDADHARGCCYAIAFRALNARGKAPTQMDEPQFIVEYHDNFLRLPQRGWVFSRRDITAAFENRREG